MNKHLLISRVRMIAEANMASLSSHVDDGRRDRAKGVNRYFRDITRNSEGHAVLQFDTKTSGSGHQYKCYISIEPHDATLFQLAHVTGKLKSAMEQIKTADVRCFCTCKDFQYSGAEYNMKHKHDALEVDHSDRSSSDMVPSTRDPEGKHTLCKHLYSCFNGIMTGAALIMSRARKVKFEAKPGDVDTKIIGKGDKSSTGGKIVMLNHDQSKPDTSTTGNITTLNGGKAIKEEPGDSKAITILGNSSPVDHSPEIGEALDALANTLMPKPDETDTSGEISVLGTGETTDTENSETEISVFNNGNTGTSGGNGMFDLEDSINSTMFNGASDDEET